MIAVHFASWALNKEITKKDGSVVAVGCLTGDPVGLGASEGKSENGEDGENQ